MDANRILFFLKWLLQEICDNQLDAALDSLKQLPDISGLKDNEMEVVIGLLEEQISALSQSPESPKES